MFARARAFQEKQQEEANKNVENLFQLKIIVGGDSVNYPKTGDSCSIHYIAYLEDGTCFDNSYNRGHPIHFIVGADQLISGLDMIVPHLSRGTKARVVIPAEYGYGDKGYPPIIPPKSKLLYEIELITFSSIGNAELLLRERRAKDPYAL